VVAFSYSRPVNSYTLSGRIDPDGVDSRDDTGSGFVSPPIRAQRLPVGMDRITESIAAPVTSKICPTGILTQNPGPGVIVSTAA
jgi:hypothetical protein